MAWGGSPVLEPTYGNREDVEKCLRDDYEILESEDFKAFHEQLKTTPKRAVFYFDAILKSSETT
jgi:hypothetical protein